MTTANRPDGWVPDARTVMWWVGRAHESRIVDTLRAEVIDRAPDLPPLPEAFWQLVAEVAVEHLTFDLVRQAQADGTVLPE